MRTSVLAAILLTTALPALAEGTHNHGDTRQLDAHEHGTSTLNIAFDGGTLMMELDAPGADIVGFEHAAESDADRAAIEAAKAVLVDPATLFALPAAAGCTLASADAHLAGEDAGHDHDHSHDHSHDEAEAGHSEFHAEYSFDCADPAAVTSIGFGFFDAFPNAQKVDVQVVGPNGAQAFEVDRAAPTLALDGLM
jgi:ABC-type nickel/cobalt efflux system permease component RcnA